MSIRFRCHCGKKLKADDHAAGKRVKCPTCGKVLVVPAADMDSVVTEWLGKSDPLQYHREPAQKDPATVESDVMPLGTEDLPESRQQAADAGPLGDSIPQGSTTSARGKAAPDTLTQPAVEPKRPSKPQSLLNRIPAPWRPVIFWSSATCIFAGLLAFVWFKLFESSSGHLHDSNTKVVTVPESPIEEDLEPIQPRDTAVPEHPEEAETPAEQPKDSKPHNLGTETPAEQPKEPKPQNFGTESPTEQPNDAKADNLSIADLIELIEPAVVRIDIVMEEGTGIGSGFVVGRDGVVVTNHHVVEGATDGVITFHDGTKARIEGALFVDPGRDLAVIKINAEMRGDLPVLRIAEELPRKGDRVVAFGAPKGLSFTATEGIVSSIRKGEDIIKGLVGEDLAKLAQALGVELRGTWIQTTAPISGGSSGGPLVNLRAEVVGANTMTIRDAQNVNFAISAADIRESLEKAKAQPVVTLAKVPKSSRGRTFRGIASRVPETEEAKKFFERLMRERDQRVKRIEELEGDLESEKEALKHSILSLDTLAEQKSRRRISEIAREINRLIDEAINIDIPMLDPHNFRTGQIGHFGGSRFEVLQVIDSETGSALLTPLISGGRLGKSFFVRNVDLSSIVDDDLVTVSANLIFEVTGTRTYQTVLGGTNTAFELVLFLNVAEIEGDLTNRRRTETGREEPSLTAGERKQLEDKRREEAPKEWQTLEPKLANGMTGELIYELQQFASQYEGTPEATQASNELKAASKLHLAKQLIQQGKRDAGEHWLRGILDEWPETTAAGEARRLLGKE